MKGNERRHGQHSALWDDVQTASPQHGEKGTISKKGKKDKDDKKN